MKNSPKSKKNKNSKLIEKKCVAPDQTINHAGSTTISFKGSGGSINKLITTPSICDENPNSMNINRNIEESGRNKCRNKSINNSTFFKDTSHNDRLLSKQYDSVNHNTHLNLVNKKKPLSPINLQKPHNSSLTASDTHINTKNKPPKVIQTLNLVDNVESIQRLFQPAFEHKQINNKEEIVIDGMFQLISTYIIAISKFLILLF